MLQWHTTESVPLFFYLVHIHWSLFTNKSTRESNSVISIYFKLKNKDDDQEFLCIYSYQRHESVTETPVELFPDLNVSTDLNLKRYKITIVFVCTDLKTNSATVGGTEINQKKVGILGMVRPFCLNFLSVSATLLYYLSLPHTSPVSNYCSWVRVFSG